jgi:hypothetical protein
MVKGLQSDIFRLVEADVIKNHMEGPNSFPDLLSTWEREGLVKITQTAIRFLFTGSQISLEHCGSDDVMKKHQGIPKHVRVFDEATQIAERRIRWLRAWVSMPEDMKDALPDQLRGTYPHLSDEQLREFFPRIYYITNPIGISAGYFRRNFVKAMPRLSIVRAPDNDGGHLRQYIPAKVEDNPSEDAEAVRRRVSGLGDEAMSDALLNENWDAPTGDFFKEFREEIHVIPDLIPPEHWTKWRSFDWGHTEPFAVLWLAVSDGEEFLDQLGRRRWLRKGAVVVYREWYGCKPEAPSEGLGLSNVEIAQGIVKRTHEKPGFSTWLTVTDSLPFQARGGVLMADEFRDNGVALIRGNTARMIGWKHVKDYLIGVDDYPMLGICESCVYLRDYLPALQRHKANPEDAVESGEATHSTDTLRLGLMVRPSIRTAPVAQQSKPGSITPETIIKRLEQGNNASGLSRR